MKRQMEEELRKKEEELANLSKSYEERMREAAVANQVMILDFWFYLLFGLDVNLRISGLKITVIIVSIAIENFSYITNKNTEMFSNSRIILYI